MLSTPFSLIYPSSSGKPIYRNGPKAVFFFIRGSNCGAEENGEIRETLLCISRNTVVSTMKWLEYEGKIGEQQKTAKYGDTTLYLRE
jgi:hypothetical protein